MPELPSGTVTFLFTDIEGSTRLLHELGDEYVDALAAHRRVLRAAFADHSGVEVDTQGDAFFVAFARAGDALEAARDGQRGLADSVIRVRMGIHTGEPVLTAEGYVGMDVHRAARIAAAGHGGQVLVSESTKVLAGADGLQDLGEHRLKDLTASERIYQLGADEFPALKTLNQTNLPVQPSSLVGRESELADVLELLQSSRLVTLTGPGGSGKTRLALQAAAQVVDEFKDGVWFVSLAAVDEPELISEAIASVIGSGDDVTSFLHSKQMILLLDNVEQLLPQAAYVVARLLDSPGLKVMATSRERLAVGPEYEYVVPTLVLDEAIALFSARARQLQPAFVADAYVAEIARRLDGLPLALELAASRVKLLTPQQILDRLGTSLDLLTTGMRDAPLRQRTLRDTIRWSYELLSEGETKCFEDLAIFAGSFGLESAEAVSRCDLNTLQSLVDKSLLRRTAEGRFFLLDTIRSFGEERLIERGRSDEVAARHAIHFLEVVEAVRPDLRSIGQEQAYVLLAIEYPNVRKALTTFTAHQEWEHELRLATSLMLFWYDRGMLAEARRWFETGLAVTQPAKLRAAANAAFAGIAFAAGDFDRAEELASATLASALETTEVDPRDRIRAWTTLAKVAQDGKNDPAAAERLLREASQLAEQTGDTSFASYLKDDLAHAAWHRGDYRRAAELFGERLSGLREAGNAMGSAVCLTNIGGLALIDRDEVRAREAFRESAKIVCRLGALAEVPHLLVGLAGTSPPEQSREAATWLGAARKMWRDFGLDISSDKPAQQIFELASSRIRERLGDPAFTAAFAEGEASDVEDVIPFLQRIVAASKSE